MRITKAGRKHLQKNVIVGKSYWKMFVNGLIIVVYLARARKIIKKIAVTWHANPRNLLILITDLNMLNPTRKSNEINFITGIE